MVEMGSEEAERGRQLCACAAEGDLDAVVALLREGEGVSPNGPLDEGGRTPLFAAVSEGHEAVALELLRHPSVDTQLGRLDAQGRVEVPLLCAAAYEGQTAVVDAILRKG